MDYTISAGDTLSKIAKANGTDVATIVRLNNISNPNKIVAGHVLRLPEKVTTDVVAFSSEAQQTDGTVSNKTQTKNTNMKNMKTSYDSFMKAFDEDMLSLPEGVDKEKFKEMFKGGYQAHIVDNDFPDSVATPADFTFDLLYNAYNGCGVSVDLKELVQQAANLSYFHSGIDNDTIGGQKCLDILTKPFTVVDDPEVGMKLQFEE